MESSHRVVDVDAHFFEDLRTLVEHFDEPYRSELLEQEDPEYALRMLVGGFQADRTVGGRIKRDEVYQSDVDMDKESVRDIMEKLGLDSIILIANLVLFASSAISTDDYRAKELCKAYTQLMVEDIVDPTDGIYTVIPAPYEDPQETVKLVEAHGDKEGVVALCMITDGAEPPLGNRKYDVIYEACVDNELPVIFHSGSSGLDGYHIKGYGKFIETHSIGFLEANVAQLTSLVIQGIPEKYPELDIMFQESGLGWIPTIMYRLDTEYMKRQLEAPLLEKRPSEYIKEFYFGTQPIEEDVDFVESVFDHVGVDQIMYASDYPHWDYDEPSVIQRLPFLDEGEKAKVLGGNANRVFGI